jgi:outer membrane protein OmpA-like peptidoglycan-associated protein
MGSDLLSEITNQFSGDALSQISSATNLSPTKTLSAIGDLVPAALGSLARKASTTEGANDVLDVIRRNNLASVSLDDVTRKRGVTDLANTGRSMTDFIFGGSAETLFDWIGTHTGINRSSLSSLAGIVGPVVLGLIGRRLGSTGMNASSLSGLLGNPMQFFTNAPAGLAGALGLTSAASAASRFTDTSDRRVVTAPAYAARPARSVWGWLLPLLLVVGAIGLLGYLLTRRQQPVPVATQPVARTEVPAPAAPQPAAPNIPVPNLGAFIDTRLPDGTSLHIPSNGVENRLLAFISDPAKAVDKNTWFSFDRLEFETDSATLKPSSREQLSNVAAILKAYPNVNLKIGGYTDNSGDPAHNLKLSQNRATNTINELVSLGVAKSRLAAEGYGEQFPVADNSTEEGRQRNRRIDMRVTAK